MSSTKAAMSTTIYLNSISSVNFVTVDLHQYSLTVRKCSLHLKYFRMILFCVCVFLPLLNKRYFYRFENQIFMGSYKHKIYLLNFYIPSIDIQCTCSIMKTHKTINKCLKHTSILIHTSICKIQKIKEVLVCLLADDDDFIVLFWQLN